VLQLMSTIVCDCPRDEKCKTCFAQAIMWFGGMARERGVRWAESVARRQPRHLAQPWPHNEGRPAELARAKVADLSEDPRIVERLAANVAEAAERRWTQLQGAARDDRSRGVT